MQINQFSQTATSLAPDDLIGIDKKVGILYVTSRISAAAAFGNTAFMAVLGNPPIGVPGGVPKTIDFNAKTFDAGSEFDLSTHAFVPLYAGYYSLTGQVRGQGFDPNVLGGVLITKNGSVAAELYSDSNTDGTLTVSTTVLVSAAAGDIFKVQFRHDNPTTITVTPIDVFFCGHRVL